MESFTFMQYINLAENLQFSGLICTMCRDLQWNIHVIGGGGG